MFGSQVNGLATKGSSDIDVTIIIRELSLAHEEILGHVLNVIQKK